MAHKVNRVYEFSSFRLDVAERRLQRDGDAIALTPKAFDVLVALVEHNGRLLEKHVLMKMVWPDSFVEENNLADNISRLRKVLGERGREFIETIPKKGYRFIAEVKELSDAAPIPVDASGQARAYLRWTVLAVTVVAVALTVAALTLYQRRSLPPDVESLAILPFDGTPEVQYLSDGIPEGLIDNLSGLAHLQVIARATAFHFRGKEWNPRQIGHDLNVHSVLAGRVALRDEALTVQVDLVNAQTGKQIWGERYRGKLSDLPSMEQEIRRRVADKLHVRVTAEVQQTLARRDTDDAEAYQLYLSGVFFFSKRTRDGIDRAIDYFEQAVLKDPNYARAYAALANCYVTSSAGSDPLQLMPKARAAAMKALEIDSHLAEAHASLGWIKWIHDVDSTGAEREFLEALRLDSNSADSHYRYARLLADSGRFEEARAHVIQAIQLEPLAIQYKKGLPYILYLSRHYEEAITGYKDLTEMAPDFTQARRELGLAYEQKGEYAEAFQQLQKNPGNMARADIAHVYAVWGKKTEARRVLAELLEKSKHGYIAPYDVAVVYAGLGDTDQAFVWLEKAIERRSYWLVWLKLDPRLDNLRLDARFSSLLQRALWPALS